MNELNAWLDLEFCGPDGYLALLLARTATHMQSRNNPLIEKTFAEALRNLEEKIDRPSVGLVEICEKYSERYAKLGYSEQSTQLKDIAACLRNKMPNTWAADGRILEGWERKAAKNELPQLPVEFRASRTQAGPGGAFLTGCFVSFVVSSIFFGGLLRPVFEAAPFLKDIGVSLFLISIPAGGFIACLWSSHQLNLRRRAWCILTDTHIEFEQAGQRIKLRWDEVERVDKRWDSGDGEDVSYFVAEITSGARKIRVSSQVFTDDQATAVYDVAKFKTHS